MRSHSRRSTFTRSPDFPARDVEAPTRVLWLIKGLGPGGAERLLTLHARLADRERVSCRVAYLLPWKNAFVSDLERERIPIVCLGARSSWDPRWVLRLRALLADEPVDVIHAHSPLAAIGARVALRTIGARLRPRLVTTEHNVWESHAGLTQLVDTLTSGLDDAHVAVSDAVRASMPARLRPTTEVIRYGVDVDDVRRAGAARAAMRTELGIAADDLVIGTVANLRPNKAYPDLLAAARRVLDRRERVRFVAVGQGPQEDEIRALHAQLGLGDDFLLLGYRDDAVRVMSAFDVFCLASHHEGLPIALMEALALGLPVVATAVGGVGELVTHGDDALLVPAARPDQLADALVELIDRPAVRDAMSARARERVDLSIEHAVRRIEAVYSEVLGR